MSISRKVGVVCLTALAVFAIACGPSEDEQAAAARSEEWTALEGIKGELDDLRGQLSDLEDKIAAADFPDAEDAAAALETAQAEAATLADSVTEKADELMTRLVTYINNDPPTQGEELTPEQLAAFRLKSSEDMITANEFVEKGGDYKRAADILEQALKVDPENPDLQERLAWVQDMRFMTKERFDQVENGMTEEQVRDLLGPVNLRNIREFEDGKYIGWFYLKDPEAGGGAAAVYFQKDKDIWTSYRTDFNALEGQEG